MTTLTELGVTTAKLREYGHDGKFEALTGPQLQGICCYLKTVLDKKEGKFKRWSKSVAKEMRGIGITQHPRNGEPSINYRKSKVVENISVSLEDFNRVEDELQVAQETIRETDKIIGELQETIQQLQDAELMKSDPGVFDKPEKIEGEFVMNEVEPRPNGTDYYAVMDPVKEPIKKKRKRRSKEQIEADKAK